MIQAADSFEIVKAASDHRQLDGSAAQSPIALMKTTEASASTGVHSLVWAGASVLPAQSRLYLPQLDGLRSLAFLLVFCSHAGVITPSYPQLPVFARPFTLWYQDLAWFGWTGVDLFLVLSAFLITSILVREEQQFGSINPKLFLLRRILRIWPVYFFAVITGLLLFPILNLPAGAKLGSPGYWHVVLTCAPWLCGFALNIGIATLLMNPPANLNPLWSISLEEQFYLFWAFFFNSVRRMKTRYVALGTMLVFTVSMRAYINSILPGHIPYFLNTLSRLDPLIFGATAAFVLETDSRIRGLVAKFGLLILAASIGLLSAVKISNPDIFAKEGFNPLSLTMIDLGWALFVVSLTSVPILIRAFATKHLVSFGKLTYGMYVFHAPVLECLIRYVYHPLQMETDCIWRPVFNWIVGLPLTFLVASIVWNTFEKRIYLLKFKYSPVPSGHNS